MRIFGKNKTKCLGALPGETRVLGTIRPDSGVC
jgi:hypothetical protein